MSKRASEILARMRQVTMSARESRGPGPEAPESGLSAPVGGRRTRVRFTLDLSSEQHRFLRRFALEADTDASQVLRVLLRLLEQDPHLAHRVLTELDKQ